jgi:hypothetical protein
VNQYQQVIKDLECGKTLFVRGSSYHENEKLVVVAVPCTAQNKTLFKKSFFLDASEIESQKDYLGRRIEVAVPTFRLLIGLLTVKNCVW